MPLFHWLLSHIRVLLLVSCSAYCSHSTCPDFKLFLSAQTDKIVFILLKSLCWTWLGHEMGCQMLTHCRPGHGTQYPSSLSSNFTNWCHLDGHLVPFRELIEIVNERPRPTRSWSEKINIKFIIVIEKSFLLEKWMLFEKSLKIWLQKISVYDIVRIDLWIVR